MESKSKPTPLDKENDKRRKNLQLMCNRISSAVCFKTAKTWRDVLAMEGMSESDMMKSPLMPVLSAGVDNVGLRKHFDDLKAELELHIRNGASTPAGSDAMKNGTEAATLAVHTDTLAQAVKAVVEEVKPAVIEINNTDNDYGFSPSPHETAFLYWFQKKAVVDLFDGIVKHNKRGQLLLSSTGTGKTFMAGALLRRLVDVKFAEDKTYGAVQYLYVTRATIVEQTKRVFEKFFGLGIRDGVEVLNIEQLRSRAGSIWVDEKMEIVNGEEQWSWTWKKMVNPVVCQLTPPKFTSPPHHSLVSAKLSVSQSPHARTSKIL